MAAEKKGKKYRCKCCKRMRHSENLYSHRDGCWVCSSTQTKKVDKDGNKRM